MSNYDPLWEDEELAEKNPGCLAGLVRAFMAMAVVSALVLALLPAIMSSDAARRMVIDAVNRRIAPAKVDAGGWSLGWFTKISIRKPFYEDPAQGILFRGDEVAFDRGLWRLLPVGKLDLGTVKLVKPDLALSLAPPGAAERKKPEAVRAPKGKGVFFLPVVDVGLGLAVENGRAEVRGDDGEPFVADGINGLARMDSYREPAEVDLAMTVGGGSVTLQGRLQSFMDFIKERDAKAQTQPEKISIKLMNVDIAVLRPLLRHATGKPWIGSGTTEGVVTVSQSGKGRFAADCGLLVNGFSLEDGDRKLSPACDLALMADVWHEAGGLEIRKFDFSSPWLRAEAQGVLKGLESVRAVTGKVKANATARLPVIARDFAVVLGLAPGFKLERGDLNAVFSVEGGADAVLVDVKAETAGLSMMADGARLTLEPAPSVLFKARFPYGGWPDVETFHFKAPFADLYGKGRFESAVVKGRLDLTRFARDFKKILKGCPPMVGSAHVDMATAAGPDGVKVTALFKISDMAVESRPGQLAVLPQGTVQFAGNVPVKAGMPEREFKDVAFKAVLADGWTEGGWLRLALPEVGRETVLRGFSLKSDLNVAALSRLLGGALPAVAQRRLRAWQGRVLANVTAEMAGGAIKARVNAGGVDLRHTSADGVWRVPDVRVEGAVSREDAAAEMRMEAAVAGGAAFVRDGVTVFAEPAAQADIELRAPPGGDRLLVPKFNLKSGLLEMDGTAELKDLPGRCVLAAKGRAAVDFAALTGLLDAWGLGAFKMTGRKAREFSFAAPMAGGWPTVLSEGEFTGASRIESLKGMGLKAEPADISLRMSQGVVKMDYAPVLNGGRLRLAPEAQVGARGVALTVPPKTRLLENVVVTQEMVDLLLARVNPLFMGSAVKSGTVTADLKSFRYVPDAVPEKQLAAELEIVFNRLSMEMGQSLREVLSLVKVKGTRYEVDRLPVSMSVKDGRVHLAPLRIVVDGQPVTVSGWAAFDGTIKYLIEVPVTERLAGRLAGKILRDTVIKIPVTGTVEEPRLDTSVLKDAMTKMFKSVISEKTAEKVGDFLEKLQRELKK